MKKAEELLVNAIEQQLMILDGLCKQLYHINPELSKANNGYYWSACGMDRRSTESDELMHDVDINFEPGTFVDIGYKYSAENNSGEAGD